MDPLELGMLLLTLYCFNRIALKVATICQLNTAPDSNNVLSCSLVQASRSLHTSPQSLAPVPPLPEKGGKVRHGLIPEELFQFLYPKTGVTGWYQEEKPHCWLSDQT